MSILKKFSIMNRGLRYKLMVAFALMSVIPLMACLYIMTLYAFPHLQDLLGVSAIIIIAIIIAVLGLFLAKGLVDPVINMAIEAKMIANGEYDNRIAIASDDEIGNLGQSINFMTQKIKTNLEELKSYGQRMREINIDIHKKVLGLSSLLQIGDILSAGNMQIESLLAMAVEKASAIFETGFGALYLPQHQDGDLIAKITYNLDKEKLGEIVLKKGGGGILEKALETRSVLILDKSVKPSRETENFRQNYYVKNILAIPIYTARGIQGLFVVGCRADDFKFKNDDVELEKVFVKQITIAIESDILNRKAEELAIKDDLTGLYNKTFILTRLEEEIKRAVFYQRPCSFIIFSIDDFKNFREAKGELMTEEVLKKIGRVIKDNTSPVGKAARVSGEEFAMLLPEKNKKEAISIAEEIKRKIESASLLREEPARLTVSGGVGENPIDGATADEIFKKAMEAVKTAKSQGGARIAT